MTFASTLEPQALWRHFDEILTIPRASKKEEAMRRYVIAVAERHGLPHRVDDGGNLVVSKPATAGREGVPITVLQSHLDMVNEKNSDVAHDFERDPIQPRREGEYLKATGTTLGADNGIGVAAMLALMEAGDVGDLAHGPLEFLFTVEEEIGLEGAGRLDPALVTGRRLLNLDSEEEGAVTVGCAGAAMTRMSLPLEKNAVPGDSPMLEVKVAGLQGGHSGLDIHLQRGNAVKVLVRALLAAFQEQPFRLSSLKGGDKHNVLPREASARIVAPTGGTAGGLDALRQALEKELQAAREELRPAEPDLRFEITAGGEHVQEAWTEEATGRALSLLEAIPHGVLAMSYDIPGLVETSTNLASAVSQDGSLVVLQSSRSSVASSLRATRRRLRAVAGLAGAGIEENEGYPAWKPDLASPLLATVRKVHERVLGHDPEIKAIHAGLECGVIGDKCPGMDMISFGPQIEFPHSPDERVHVESVERFWRLLTATLEELAV